MDVKMSLSAGLELETELCVFTDQTVEPWRSPLASLAKLIQFVMKIVVVHHVAQITFTVSSNAL